MLTPACTPDDQVSLASLASLAADGKRAEVLLHDLAMELRLVPLAHPGLSQLHVRALALRRDVTHWPETLPAEAIRKAVIEELRALQERARSAREMRR
jgi:hypothetical protein